MTENKTMSEYRQMVAMVEKRCRREALQQAETEGEVKREHGAVRILVKCKATKRMKQTIFAYPKGIEEEGKRAETAKEVEATMGRGLCSMCPLKEGGAE